MPHIHPVSDLKNRGHGELVLLGMEEYESLLAKTKTCEDENAEIEALWVAELQERYRAIQEGTVECIPADEAMHQARERIRR